MAPGVVEVLEVVDVDHRQGQRLTRGDGFGAGALQFVVESLAVCQIGQGVGRGVPAHLLEMLAQLVHLGGGFLELLLQRLVLLLHLTGGRGEGVDDGLQRGRHVGRGQLLGHVRQGLAVVAGRPLGRGDGLGDGLQFLAELVPGVPDLIVEPGLGQVGGRKLLGDGFGERFADGRQPGDLLGERPVGILHAVQEDLVVQGRRPRTLLLHGPQGFAREVIGLGSTQKIINWIRHRRPLTTRSRAPVAHLTDERRYATQTRNAGLRVGVNPG